MEIKRHVALIYLSDGTAEARTFKLFVDAEKYCDKERKKLDFSFSKIYNDKGEFISCITRGES
jgi:hypothetical protein